MTILRLNSALPVRNTILRPKLPDRAARTGQPAHSHLGARQERGKRAACCPSAWDRYAEFGPLRDSRLEGVSENICVESWKALCLLTASPSNALLIDAKARQGLTRFAVVIAV